MHAEQTQVAPVAGVEFLAVNHQRAGLRGRVNPDPAEGDVGYALLLVHEQILDNVEILRLRLQDQVRRRVAVVSAVVHVHVHIRAHPAPVRSVKPGARRHHGRDLRGRSGADLDRVPLGLVRKALHQLDAHGARGDLDQVVAGGMKVARLERMRVTVELGMMRPGVGRGIEPSRRVRDHCAGRRRRSTLVAHRQAHGPAGAQTVSVRRLQLSRAAAGQSQQAQLRVAVAIGNEGNVRPVRRPSWAGFVPVAESQRKRLPASGGHQPQLQPVASEVRAVDDPCPVGREVRSRLPVGLLVTQLNRVRAGNRRRAPETPGAVNATAIGNEHDRLAVACPGRVDLVVVGAVVIPRQRALVLPRQPQRICQLLLAHLGCEHVKVAVVARRHIDDPPTIRRPARLDVDRATLGQLPCAPRSQIKQPQLDRLPLSRRIDDEASVR